MSAKPPMARLYLLKKNSQLCNINKEIYIYLITKYANYSMFFEPKKDDLD